MSRAQALLEEGLALFRQVGYKRGLALALVTKGLVVFDRGEHAAARATARALFEEGLTLCRESGNKPFATFYLEGLERTVAAQGQPAWAAPLWGAAERLRPDMNTARAL